MTAGERYGLNPYMDARVISKHSNFDPDALGLTDVKKDKISLGGSLDFYFTSGSEYDIPLKKIGGRDVKQFGFVEVKNSNAKSLKMSMNFVVDDQLLEMEIDNKIGTAAKRTVPVHGVKFKTFVHLRVACAEGGAEIYVNGKRVDTVAEVLADAAPFAITHYKWDVVGKEFMGSAHRVTRNGVYPNGVADDYGYSVKQSQSASLSASLQTISAGIKLPKDNAIVAVYGKGDQYGYIPFQFTNKCYHTSAGNARCFPESGRHESAKFESGFGGGKNGRLVDVKCLSGYVFFGVTCSRPLDTATKMTNAEATTECGDGGDMLYFPPNKMQNVVFREAFKKRENVNQAEHTVWLGIRRAGGRWVANNGQPITAAQADWAEGQPIVAGDCAVADAAMGYKWRATSCDDSHTFICTLSRPNCPRGYKFSITVNNQGGTNSDSCLSVRKNLEDGNGGFHHVSLFDDMCRVDGPRLAVPGSTTQMENMVKFLTEEEPTWRTGNGQPAGSKLFLGFRTDTQGDVSVSARQFAPYLAPKSFEGVASTNRPPVALATDSEGTTGKCYLLTKAAKEERRLNGSACGFRSDRETVWGLCHYKVCRTVDKNNCFFPFRYQGRMYDTCITLGNGGEGPWCPTLLDEDKNAIEGHRGVCGEDCDVNDCPVGFYRNYMDYTCHYVSPNHDGLAVPDVATAREKCRLMGSTLYEPRTRHGMTMILGAEMKSDEALQDFAIGMRVDAEGEVAYTSDGSRVTPEILAAMDFESGHPVKDKEDQRCIVISDRKLKSAKCDNYTVNDPNAGGKRLGYICGARPLETVDRRAGCHFPFRDPCQVNKTD